VVDVGGALVGLGGAGVLVTAWAPAGARVAVGTAGVPPHATKIATSSQRIMVRRPSTRMAAPFGPDLSLC
jgi:hypothetical protein